MDDNVTTLQLGDLIDVVGGEVDYAAVRVIEFVDDVRVAVGMPNDEDDAEMGGNFRGVGFVGKTDEGDELPVHVWYRDRSGNIIDYVRKETLTDADMFLARELRGQISRSTRSSITVTFFGPDGLVGVAVDTRL